MPRIWIIGLLKFCTKSVTMQDIVIVVDNDISVHCSFSESGPIVGNFHRALVSRHSSGHRCFTTRMFVEDSFTSELDFCPRTMRSSYLFN